MERQGRGAWPQDGWGGTLNAAGTKPGRYYSLAADPLKQVGLSKVCKEIQNRLYSINESATFHGVLAIQVLLIEDFDAALKGDGVYGPSTAESIRDAQIFFGISADGVVGKETMRWLLWPHIHKVAQHYNVPWEAVYGLLEFEGNWDPGAVGWLDANDLGLAQINLPSHPDVTQSEAFCPSYAMNFLASYIANGLEAFDGNIIDAIISYNLGIGGTRQWISDGRPVQWSPPWSNLERRPFEYADRILSAANP